MLERLKNAVTGTTSNDEVEDMHTETETGGVSELDERIVAALRTVYDPEIPVNIYDLGLIYGYEFADDGSLEVRMTLTAPGCPVAGIMPGMVESAVKQVEGIDDVHVELVWDPPWSQERMSDEARLQLGMF